MTIFNHKSMARTPSQRAGNSRLSVPTYRLGVVVLLLIVLGSPVSAVAQCPGTMVDIAQPSSRFRSAFETMSWPASIGSCFNMPTATMSYSGVPFGPTAPTLCPFTIVPTPPGGRKVYFGALWPGAVPGSSNGCDFTCPNAAGGSCVVLPDGLPVELLEFSVEDDSVSSDQG